MCRDVTLHVRLGFLFVTFDSCLLAMRTALLLVQASAAVYIMCPSSSESEIYLTLHLKC